jgi:hypothetical protein
VTVSGVLQRTFLAGDVGDPIGRIWVSAEVSGGMVTEPPILVNVEARYLRPADPERVPGELYNRRVGDPLEESCTDVEAEAPPASSTALDPSLRQPESLLTQPLLSPQGAAADGQMPMAAPLMTEREGRPMRPLGQQPEQGWSQSRLPSVGAPTALPAASAMPMGGYGGGPPVTSAEASYRIERLEAGLQSVLEAGQRQETLLTSLAARSGPPMTYASQTAMHARGSPTLGRVSAQGGPGAGIGRQGSVGWDLTPDVRTIPADVRSLRQMEDLYGPPRDDNPSDEDAVSSEDPDGPDPGRMGRGTTRRPADAGRTGTGPDLEQSTSVTGGSGSRHPPTSWRPGGMAEARPAGPQERANSVGTVPLNQQQKEFLHLLWGSTPAQDAGASQASIMRRLEGAVSGNVAQPDLQSLIQLETLKALRGLRKPSGDDGGNSSEGEDGAPEDLDGCLTGSNEHSKLKWLQLIRRTYRRHPEKLVKAYVHLVRERTGITDPREYFALQLYSRAVRNQFGRHTGLFRIHHYASLVMDLGVIQGLPLQAFALLGQLLKAVHQVALSNGSWELAALMIPASDPLGPARFAGDYAELSAVASYRDAMTALIPRVPGGPGPSEQPQGDDEEETAAPAWKSRQRSGAAGKAKAKAASAAAAAAAAKK